MNPSDRFEELREIYPGLSDAELEEVEETLDRYLAIVRRIVERDATDFDSGAPATLS